MIPVRLKLKNFLPYRGEMPLLTFEGIHLACISGDNGAGKTSIIDAMTWALWGKSRLRSKASGDDDLITQGESETAVTFDFRAGDGQVYRVERRRTKPKRSAGAGHSELSLFLVSGEEVTNISGSILSETAAKITSLLRLDYETFINSAYLRQGEADHFTELTPNKRKEVLGTILNLDIYEQLSDSAKARADQAVAAKKMLTDSIGLEQTKLAQEPEIEAALAAATQDSAGAEAGLKEKQAVLDELKRTRQLVESQRQALGQAEAGVREITGDLTRRQAELAANSQRITQYRLVIAEKPAIEAGYAGFQAAVKRNTEFSQKLMTLRQFDGQAKTLEAAVSAALNDARSTRVHWQTKFDELAARAAELPKLKAALSSLAAELAQLAVKEKHLDGLATAIQQLKTEDARIEAETASLRKQLAENDSKAKLLADSSEAACPVCETELSQDRLTTVLHKYHSDKAAIQERLDSLSASAQANELKRRQLTQELDAGATLKAERTRLTNLDARLGRDIEEAEKAAGRLPEGEKHLADLNRKIETGDFAPEERRRLAELEAQIKQVGYDTEEHRRTSETLAELEPFDRKHRELAEAEKLLAADEQARLGIEASIGELNKRLAAREQEAAELRAKLAELPVVDDAALQEAERLVAELKQQATAATRTTGVLQQNLAQLQELKKDIAAKTAEIRRQAETESIYRDLKKYFGRDGIQAALIDNAIPRMEAEANQLLARMTDNRMSLKLELQRLTRKGETTETFDIKVSDELGTRDYDLFSGGEAFRINFALRLALSRLLADRTGAPLRTLIIDEGFGTQDAAGIDKLKEAIAGIQDQFDCILVITHIEEFKDAFPARIEVCKTADGSSIQVNYN
ncbi:MAG: SMC family ATPase [Dehalogenimonas sp.]|uniref:Nuclease SbcCD subunit C n=1 Tax=Candidatus Dehalogenimonas loeffleri TaxID=3127115 RepID=A0ABZ2J6S5_9CHLR|nr:SMC family ATPase [Dehalogenimonas sp.]